MQRAARSRRRPAALQIALQPLGQPRAARPDADQRGVGCSSLARRRAVRRTALRRRAAAWSRRSRRSALPPRGRLRRVERGLMLPLRNCSRISAAAAASTSRAPCAIASTLRVALVDLVHRQTKAAVQLARERRARRVLSCAAPSGWVGTPTTSASGCHSCDQRARWRRSGASPMADTVVSGCGLLEHASCRPPRRCAGCRNQKPETIAADRHRIGATALMRAPPPGSACAGRCPAATAPCRSAARSACRRSPRVAH